MPRVTSLFASLAMIALATPPASDDRDSVSAGPLRPRLERLEAGVEDRGGIEKSLRVLPVDLRLPTGFTGVFRVPGRADLMMRGNGALFAVFPRSQYRRFGSGLLPVTPADVHYSIGMPGGFSYPGGSLRPFGEQSPADRDAASSADGPLSPQAPTSDGARRVDARVRPKPVDPVEAGDATPVAEGEVPPAVNMMPAICEAPLGRAVAGSTATHRGRARLLTIADLQLGPAVLVRE